MFLVSLFLGGSSSLNQVQNDTQTATTKCMEEKLKPRPFATEAELEEMISAFDQARIPRPFWTHREHLAVAAVYVLRNRSLDEIRVGIQRLNEANGVPQTPGGGYHETITVVWMKLISDWIGKNSSESQLVSVNGVLEAFGDRDFLFAHYSRERLMSVEARYGWVEPDLKELG